MANTPNRVIRVEAPLWDAYGQVCDAEGVNRSDDLRNYMQKRIRAFVRTGGAVNVSTGNQATHDDTASAT